jgi:RNA polymerase sigma factor for flagellar operon FliA
MVSRGTAAGADPTPCGTAGGDEARPRARRHARDDAPDTEELALWQRAGEGDSPARSLLVARFLPYAKAIAASLYARRPMDDVEFEEYQQFGVVGLLEAIDRYRGDRGARFTTFAMPRIRGAILSGVEHVTERRQQAAFRRRVLAERVGSMVAKGGTEGEGEALLGELVGIGVGVALGLILEGTGMVVDPEAALPDGVYANLELRSVYRQAWSLIGELTPRERDVLERHYRGGMRFEEIARTLGLTRGRISQLHQQAIGRLRALMARSRGCDVTY